MSEVFTVLASALIAFLVAWGTTRAEESRGRALLYTLCSRYFIAAYNSIDPSSNKLRQTSLEKQQVQEELKAILKDLSSLSTNPLFIRLIKQNELAAHMMVQLRREVIERDSQDQLSMNRGTMEHFIKTYDWCKKSPWGRVFKKHSSTEQLVDFFRKWLTNAST